MALRLTFDCKSYEDKMENMDAFHLSLVGSPAYINSEIAILEPNGRDSKDFMLLIGDDNEDNCDILIEADEHVFWDGETDALDPEIRLERFDDITMLALKNSGYNKSLILNNTASGIFVCPDQIDMVLTIYNSGITQYLATGIQEEFGDPVDYKTAPADFFNVSSAAIKFFAVSGFRRPKDGIMEPCTKLIASIGLWEGEETWGSLYQKKHDLWIQFISRLGKVGLTAPVTDLVRNRLETLR